LSEAADSQGSSSAAEGGALRFDGFRLDPVRRVLWRGDELLPVAPKAIDLLAVLLRRPGQVVTKEELLREVWPDTYVEEANLSVLVAQLRKVLTRDGKPPIETVHRRGYRFVGRVTEEPGAARSGPRSLAVLPLKPMRKNEDDAALGLALADALITRLAGTPGLSVRPTRSVLAYAAADAPVHEIARDLKVEGVVDGRIQRSGDRVRVTLQLIRAAGGATLWADQVEGSRRDLLALQDEACRRAIAALTGEEAARPVPPRRPAPDPEAYRAALRGRLFWSRLTPAWLQKARATFEQAIALDRELAAAHSGLADTMVLLALYGTEPPGEAWPIARAASERAVALAPEVASAHVSHGFVRLFQDWDWKGAGIELERAATLQPDSAEVLQWHALYFAMLGRFEEALQRIARAQELDPLSLTANTGLGFHLYLTQQHNPEIEPFLRTLELDPGYALAHWALGLAYERRGMHKDAVRENKKAVELAEDGPMLEANLARSMALAGRAPAARKLLKKLRAAGVSPYRLATIELALGDTKAALRELEQGVAARDHWLVWLKVDPMLDPLREEPRFQALLKPVGLA
jgi:DNA-binding winged helix-turn-helix (wHTH) protein/Flp pilus assembly protein TadD